MTVGKFITLEGVEGVGKTTNLNYIANFFINNGIDVVTTREPGGTAIAETIRQILLDHHEERLCDEAELLLMFAARAQHLEHVIKPALAAGKYVICDRFTDATYAYQGGGRHFPIQRIAWLEAFVQKGLTPDVTILLDLPVAEGLKRAANRSEPDRFESEHQAFFENVRDAYLRRASEDSERFKIIDAADSIAGVEAQIRVHLNAILNG
ncbi:MAG: dTMP kinase [Piscirickettsiaceae bacterium]|nr:MAG: dTMP kinase [Piscirickettsiaceae bacterium]PCI68795.1 MAG: dTMP kinase [Piscirickettsiaceae bacterium]